MGLKIDFVERATEKGANLSELCREFGISRPTGHKWLKRFRVHGHAGLEEESRRPKNVPLATGEEIVAAIIQSRDANPSWGPKKLRIVLARRWRSRAPSEATIARVLRRLGKIKPRRKSLPLSIIEQAPRIEARAPNALWSVDFKGWWRTKDGERCEPLTVRDAHSRFVLSCVAMESTAYEPTRAVFEKLFRKYGVPDALQMDNGAPFICSRARAGLTRLSAWWVALGIKLVRSRPGCPQDNGAHERMHRDMSQDVEAFAQESIPEQQRALDRWRQRFNHVRPHEALSGKTPSEVYQPKARRSLQTAVVLYPEGWLRRRVHGTGVITIHGEKYPIGGGLVGYDVGLEPLDAMHLRAWFRDVDLGIVEIAPAVETLVRSALRAKDLRQTEQRNKSNT